MIRVAILSEGRDSPSEAFRVLPLVEALRRHGIEATIFPSVPGKYQKRVPVPYLGAGIYLTLQTLCRLSQFARLPRFDAIVLQRDLTLPPLPIFEWLALRFNPRAIFDFDDAIYLTRTADGTGRADPPRRRKIERIIRWCRHVTAGSRHLELMARRLGAEVTRVPTVVDTERYHPRNRGRVEDGTIVGWVGIGHNTVYLRSIGGALRNIFERYPRVRLRIVSARTLELDLPEDRVERIDWSRAEEPSRVAQFDIGLSPLVDDEWTRAKCAARLLLYLASGVPAICSPVGANLDVVRHGETGLLASTPEEWERCMAGLIESPQERRRLAEEGRRHVEARYSVAVAAERFAEAIRRRVRD